MCPALSGPGGVPRSTSLDRLELCRGASLDIMPLASEPNEHVSK